MPISMILKQKIWKKPSVSDFKCQIRNVVTALSIFVIGPKIISQYDNMLQKNLEGRSINDVKQRVSDRLTRGAQNHDTQGQL